MQIVSMYRKLTYEEFYAEYYERVLKYLARKCARFVDAEELTSQAFLYCYEKYDSYDPTKCSMGSWVYMIANSRFKNYCRDRKVYVDIDVVGDFIPDDSDPVETGVMLDDLRDDIARALLKLSDLDRMIVVMSYFKNMTAVEIGEILDMKPGTVRQRLARALDKMEQELEDWRG